MRLFTSSALALISLGLAGPAFAQDVAAEGAAASGEIIVTGTRDQNRTQFTSLAPVDVLSEEAIRASASSELVDTLAQIVPSFNVQRLPAADGLVFVRPASLRNLSPDQTLVLINGRRLHRSALLGSRGSQAPDLAHIPSYAIERIEVLRDGASAQYGSDAIAGVINIILNDSIAPEAFAQAAQYYEGDGTDYQVGARFGAALGDGFVSISAEWASQEETSRTRQRPDAIAFQAANPSLTVPNPVQRWGQPELDTLKFSLNAAIPVEGTPWEVYAFGTLGFSEGLSDFNWRNPANTGSAFNTSSAFPGFNLRSIYPTGFTPRFGSEAYDVQVVGGARGEADAWSWDLSASIGRNNLEFTLDETINASLGPASPTRFVLGTLAQREVNLNADFVYRWMPSALAEPVNVAFGVERRVETYLIDAGDPASFAVGPGAATGLAPNANGFPGFSTIQAGEWDQTSYAGYIDVEAPVTSWLTLGGAIRYEEFSEFGETVDGKVSGRVEFSPNFAVRATWSTGFRAPTPGQLNATSTTQGLDTVTLQIFNRGRLSPSDPIAIALGARPLEAEESETASFGVVFAHGGFTATIDAYQIDVTNRFSESSAFAVPSSQPNPLRFTSVSYFTNDFDTQTRGIDVVGSWAGSAFGGDLRLTAAYNYNETEVTGGATGVALSTTQRRVFEEGRPQHNATASATYAIGAWEFLGRARYYGEWTDVSGNATGDIFQTFGAISLFDAAVTYNISEQVSMRVGAENVFDEYPDEATNQAVRGLIYSRNAPYDTDGGRYYVRLTAGF